MQSTVLKSILITFGLLFSHFAHAHDVQAGGFINGLMHPIFGLDHLLAMVAVGALSEQIGGKAIWKLPLTFVGLMLLSGLWGMQGLPFFAVEVGIALSVFILGVAIAMNNKKLPMILSAIAVGFFASFHGYAHGAEMPTLAQPMLYATGFLVATVGLHIFGVVLAKVVTNISKGDVLLRYIGAGLAGFGCAILMGV